MDSKWSELIADWTGYPSVENCFLVIAERRESAWYLDHPAFARAAQIALTENPKIALRFTYKGTSEFLRVGEQDRIEVKHVALEGDDEQAAQKLAEDALKLGVLEVPHTPVTAMSESSGDWDGVFS